jgi:hypothetical protein
VISAKGKYGNPDPATFDALVAARGQTRLPRLANQRRKGKPLASVVDRLRAKYPSLDLRVRPRNRQSLLINLGDEPA